MVNMNERNSGASYAQRTEDLRKGKTQMAAEDQHEEDRRPSAQEFLSKLGTKCADAIEDKDVAATLVATLIAGERDIDAIVKKLNTLAKQRVQQRTTADE